MALAGYDNPRWGGDGDGMISFGDQIWHRLRLWVDRNQDGVSQRPELSRLERFGVLALDLSYVESGLIDGNGNRHELIGNYLGRGPERVEFRPVLRRLEDVYFRILEGHTEP